MIQQENIYHHSFSVTKELRQALHGHKSYILCIQVYQVQVSLQSRIWLREDCIRRGSQHTIKMVIIYGKD